MARPQELARRARLEKETAANLGMGGPFVHITVGHMCNPPQERSENQNRREGLRPRPCQLFMCAFLPPYFVRLSARDPRSPQPTWDRAASEQTATSTKQVPFDFIAKRFEPQYHQRPVTSEEETPRSDRLRHTAERNVTLLTNQNPSDKMTARISCEV